MGSDTDELSECCDAEILEPFGEPFDMGDRVCADCGRAVDKD